MIEWVICRLMRFDRWGRRRKKGFCRVFPRLDVGGPRGGEEQRLPVGPDLPHDLLDLRRFGSRSEKKGVSDAP